MSNKHETIDIYSPGRLLLIVVISTFVVETVVMYVLSLLPQVPDWVQMLLDSALLVILSFPALYFFSFRPMAQHLAKRAQAEVALQRANDELEMRVQERTIHLENTNQELQYEIAERKRAEEALRASEARLNQSQEISHVGSWELDIVTNRLTWSDEVYRIFGLQPQKFGATYEAFLERVHPDDRAAVNAAYSDSLRNGETSYEIQHRVIRTMTGEIRWVHEKCQHTVDANGKIVRSLGMVMDITEREQAAEALRKAHDELEMRVQARTAELVKVNQMLQAEIAERTLAEQSLQLERTKLKGILDAMPDGIYIVSQQRELQYVNPVLEKAYGPVNGRKCYEYLHGQAEPCSWCLIDAVLAGQSFQTERYSDRTGKTYELFDQPLRNADGTLSKLKIMHDVTARKQAEDEIRQRNRELAALNEIGRAITSTPDLDHVLAELLDHLRQVVGASACAVGLIEAATGDVVFHHYVSGITAIEWPSGRRLKKGEGIAGWVAERRQSALIDDVSLDLRPRLDVFTANGHTPRSMAAVPLIARDAVIGVLYLLDERASAFDDGDIRLLEPVAAQAAVAIQNARLYKAEQQARRTAEILRGASMALTQSLDLNTVLDTLLEYVEQIVPFDSASVILPEGESRLVVRAQRGYERWDESEQIRLMTFDTQTNPIAYELVKGQKSILIDDTRQQPGWETRPGTEHIHSWLGVPLAVEGKVIGVCGLDKAEPGFFTQAHLQLVEALVGQAAVAVQNAWLFEQVRAGRERLTALSHRLVQVQDAERGYIARELHDEAGQSLTTLLVGLRLLKAEVNEPEALEAGVDELSRMAEGVLDNLHRLAVDLRPASLDHLGLVTALRQHITAIRHKHGLNAGFEATGFGEERLPSAVETNLYRIVQEALTNVVRYAHATRVMVLLERRDDRVSAAVIDNGIGFDPSAVLAQDGHLGLFGMRERAEMLGGTLVVESATGAGTTVTVEVPCDDTRTDHR